MYLPIVRTCAAWTSGAVTCMTTFPATSGLAAGTTSQIDYCLDCGQIQGSFPLPRRGWRSRPRTERPASTPKGRSSETTPPLFGRCADGFPVLTCSTPAGDSGTKRSVHPDTASCSQWRNRRRSSGDRGLAASLARWEGLGAYGGAPEGRQPSFLFAALPVLIFDAARGKGFLGVQVSVFFRRKRDRGHEPQAVFPRVRPLAVLPCKFRRRVIPFLSAHRRPYPRLA